MMLRGYPAYFGLSGLGQLGDDFIGDLDTDTPTAGFGNDVFEGSGFEGDPGNAPAANTPGDPYDPAPPLTSTVYLPDDTNTDQTMADNTAGMAPGETRSFVLPSGAVQRVIAAATDPRAPDTSALYKIGGALVRYVQGPTGLVMRQPVATQSASGRGWLLPAGLLLAALALGG